MDTIIGAQADEKPTAAPFWAAFVEQIEPDASVDVRAMPTLTCSYDDHDGDVLEMD